ncbi:MAG TPA: pyridoxamine 5'-phosphate oxidase [Gammaproteobacteria bacterium]|jgi:pyridoxamine 5'-phosphate oxidase|nr:pyridoxamine 5'-phosphate oxidase [Gammaproteobacteria bacterium]
MNFMTGRQYGTDRLAEDRLAPDPLNQFNQWLAEATQSSTLDPTAMVLATVDEQGLPEARVVLLKQVTEEGFVFFTHYTSPKARQAESSGVVALNFYWPALARQVRIKGQIKRLTREASVAYFATRPRESQISTAASQQSAVISDRSEWEQRMQAIATQYADQPIPCPDYWGGYCVVPYEFEFFQGRDARINDRLRYRLIKQQWQIDRLSP